MSAAITEEEFARARTDAGFRQHLIRGQFDLLLDEITRMREAQPPANSVAGRQLREGIDLAIELSAILHRMEQAEAGAPVTAAA
jgi:hypothetical protein